MKKLLITFGCSWTMGVGTYYYDGMPENEYYNTWDRPEGTFRQIIGKEINADTLNFSIGGTSNQKQFRFAKHFFASDDFNNIKKKYDEIIVLWGITSTARTEIYEQRTQDLKNIILPNIKFSWQKVVNKDNGLIKQWMRFFYNHDHEVHALAKEMHFFNSYFTALDIKNYWFDTFNHHNYEDAHPAVRNFNTEEYTIEKDRRQKDHDHPITTTIKEASVNKNKKINNMLFNDRNPRDLCSILCKNIGLKKLDNEYHTSTYKEDSNRIKFLAENKILNPYSYHPTKYGHQLIAEIILNEINTL